MPEGDSVWGKTIDSLDDNLTLFEEARAYQTGSVRITLETEPGFDLYVFIDNNKEHIRQLQELCGQFSYRNTQLIGGEANLEIRRICSTTNWQERRAVLFLDPYGMQVEWQTVVVTLWACTRLRQYPLIHTMKQTIRAAARRYIMRSHRARDDLTPTRRSG